ncbi:hypothetical protein ACH5RR_034279 [Cinchona calisaya]|uniref:RNA helicase n=1 Tax=Cinchona calisaya TaxID=153742 RepID=A0ABD2YFW2_9GENT
MKRLIKLRASNLKVLITSATLDGEKVVPLFHGEKVFRWGDKEKQVKKLEERIQNLKEGCCRDAIILPLHGSLPPELQESLSSPCVRVFNPPAPNCRLFIVATNIVETSLTVDGVVFMFVSFSSLYLTSNDRYVIDSGYVKQRQYNPSTGMYSLDVVQISKQLTNLSFSFILLH